MSEWLNNKKIILKDVVKPCKLCGFCPYGQLVEEYPLNTKLKDKRNNVSCKVFGHDCPAFYMAEMTAEEEETNDEEIAKMIDEMNNKSEEK